jgi:hypothetical protein
LAAAFFRENRPTERQVGVQAAAQKVEILERSHRRRRGNGMTDAATPANIFNLGLGFWASKTLLSAASRSGENQATVASFSPSYQIAEFEPVAKLPHCEFCSRSSEFARFFDAVYCLSLQEQPHRTPAMADLFHRLGLCANATFLRPRRAKNQPRAIWQSHRDMAHHAIDRGFCKVLLFEDDADIRIDRDRLQARLGEAMASLPDDWWGLFLGHIPLQAYPAGFHLLRARSGAAHAYIASERLLFWLAVTEPTDPEVPICRTIGAGIDAALANLPGMYAMFPMVATQRFTNDYRVDPRRDELGRPRKLTDISRYRTFLICNMARSAEALAVLLAPWHWLTLEYFRKRSGQAFRRAARTIRASNGFDEDWYVRTYPDIADRGRLPLEHYLVDGMREGRRPNAAACLMSQNPAAPGVGRWRMAGSLRRILRRIGRQNPNLR